MIDRDTYIVVLRQELAHVYAENLALKAQLADVTYDPTHVVSFLNRIDPDAMEDVVLSRGMGVRTGVAFIEALKEVAHAELGESATQD